MSRAHAALFRSFRGQVALTHENARSLTPEVLVKVTLSIAILAVLTPSMAWANDWGSYELGEFYPIESVDDPVIQRAAEAVVTFTGATGFIISPKGHVLTNYHVYDGFGDEGTIHRACDAEGCAEALKVELIVANKGYDMALYQVVDGPEEALPFIPVREREVSVDEDVFIIGHPSSKPQRVSFGTILARNIHFANLTSVEYSAQTWWGSSGSPVMDREGNAVAIHWGWDSEGVSNGRLTGIPFALMIPEIAEVEAVALAYGADVEADPIPGVCKRAEAYAMVTELETSSADTNAAGRDLDAIRVRVETDHPECLAFVEDVAYHLHPTFSNPVVNGAASADEGFPIRLKAWGYFDSRAVITLASAETLDVEGTIRW